MKYVIYIYNGLGVFVEYICLIMKKVSNNNRGGEEKKEIVGSYY